MKATSAIIIIGFAALTASGIFGFKNTALHHTEAVVPEMSQPLFNESSSNDELLNVAQTRLQKAGQIFSDAELIAKQQEDRLDKITEELQNLKKGLGLAQGRLSRLRPAVESGSGLEIGGVRYSAVEIRNETRRLENFVKASAKSIERKTNEVNQVKKISSFAQNELEKTRAVLGGAQSQLGNIDAKIKLAETSQKVSAATASARNYLSTELEGDFSQVMSMLERRLADIQSQNAALGPEPSEGIIAWQLDEALAASSENLSCSVARRDCQ